MSQNELLYAKQIEKYNKNALNRILDNNLVLKLETAGRQMNDTVSSVIFCLTAQNSQNFRALKLYGKWSA